MKRFIFFNSWLNSLLFFLKHPYKNKLLYSVSYPIQLSLNRASSFSKLKMFNMKQTQILKEQIKPRNGTWQANRYSVFWFSFSRLAIFEDRNSNRKKCYMYLLFCLKVNSNKYHLFIMENRVTFFSSHSHKTGRKTQYPGRIYSCFIPMYL